MTTMEILKVYGYQQKGDALFAGKGSLVWGFTCSVRELGENAYRVEYSAWEYDCEGECVRDDRTDSTLSLRELYEFLWGEKALHLPR